MSIYSFKHTDSTKSPIIVQPYTVNGPASPASTSLYSNPLSGISAVAATTSLVLPGKGVPEYGELVTNNLVYLLEHFANPTRPLNLTQGQIWYKNADGADAGYPSDPDLKGLYVWTGTGWKTIVLSATSAGSGNLDLAGSKIVNLGTATASGDALSLGAANALYLALAGGTLTGDVTLAATKFLSLTSSPSSGLHAANKAYVDSVAATLVSTSGGSIAGNLSITGAHDLNLAPTATFTAQAGAGVLNFGARRLQNVGTPTANGDAATKQYVDTNALPLTGGTVAGPVSIVASADILVTTTLDLAPTVNLSIQPGAGTVYFGNRRITAVGTPTDATDAATKSYVDTATASGAPYVVSGDLSVGGVLSLTLSDTSSVIVSGTFATAAHTQSDSTVTSAIPVGSQSYMAALLGGSTTTTLTGALRTFDRAINTSRAPMQSHVVTAPGGVGSFTLPAQSAYIVGSNRLAVYVDGAKKLATRRGNTRITFSGSNIGLLSSMGLAAATYATTLTIDGGSPATFSVAIPANATYRQLSEYFNFVLAGSPSAAVPAASGRAQIAWTGLVQSSATGLANNATAYTATVTIDGVGIPVSITGSTAQTFGALIIQLNTILGSAGAASIFSSTQMRITSATTGTGSTVSIADTNLFSSLTGSGAITYVTGTNYVAPIPSTTVYGATLRVEQYEDSLVYVFESATKGTGSSMVVSYAGGELFTSIAAGSAPVNTSVSANLDYKEVGAVGSLSTSVDFVANPTIGQVLEFVTHP